jgi:hypothetical protein
MTLTVLSKKSIYFTDSISFGSLVKLKLLNFTLLQRLVLLCVEES